MVPLSSDLVAPLDHLIGEIAAHFANPHDCVWQEEVEHRFFFHHHPNVRFARIAAQMNMHIPEPGSKYLPCALMTLASGRGVTVAAAPATLILPLEMRTV